MPQPIVKPFPEKSQHLADDLAKYIISIQNQSIAKHKSFYVAVSGGSLVATLRKALAKNEDVKWESW